MAVLTERVSVMLPTDLAARVREHAKERGVGVSAVMRDIVDDLLARPALGIADTDCQPAHS